MMERLETALAAMAKSFGKHFTSLKAAIDAIPEKIADAIAKRDSTPAFIREVQRIVDKLRNPEVTVDFDTSELRAEFATLKQAAQSFKGPNLIKIENALDALYVCIEEKISSQTKDLSTRLSAIEDAIKALKFNAPSTLKLDDQQFRQLSNSGGTTTGGALAGRNVRTTNISLTAANTEYSYTFPSNTVAFTIKLRDQGTLAYYAWVTGKMPAGGDSSNYMTIPQNYLRSIDGVDYSGKTIYLGAESNSQVAEVEVITA